ncbi:MAG: dual specificity protein phosphatase family protein [Chloroflexi bacterium]|nr:dual specificity protein phosphatase family protein [Chloroflexota bacterium]
MPADHGVRSLQGVVRWRAPDGVERFLLFDSSPEPGMLLFSAAEFHAEERSGVPAPAYIKRPYASPPGLPVGPVPRPHDLYQQYGGDPVVVHLGGQTCDRCLFVGGLGEQPTPRPRVDAVLNLSEDPSAWASANDTYPADRWITKGEGRAGMSVDELVAEAEWVAKRLQKGHSVLVHCSAGFNRSVTVCCATLVLLEGLSAEAALDRVREHHPWARPDAYHWLRLCWLARQQEA